MQLIPDNAICSQRLAQKLLSSSQMLPPTLKPFLLRLQQEARVDFSRLIQVSDHILTFMSGESHQKIKKSLAKSLGQKNLQLYERKISHAGNFLINSLKTASGKINLPRDIEAPLFLYIIKNIFGYIPKSDEEFLNEIDIAARFSEPMQSVKSLIEVQNVFEQLTTEISAQLNNSEACGLIYDIRRGLNPDNVDCHSKERVATIIAILIIATRTTSETLSNILIENSRLKGSERERFSDELWVKKNIDTLIRFCAPNTYLTRTASQDMRVDDYQIAKNDVLLVHIPSSNRDPSYYDCCDYAKLSDQPAKRHLSFGAGVHRCPGSLLGTMILSHVVPRLYQHFPELRVDTNKLTYKSTRVTTRLRYATASLY